MKLSMKIKHTSANPQTLYLENYLEDITQNACRMAWLILLCNMRDYGFLYGALFCI